MASWHQRIIERSVLGREVITLGCNVSYLCCKEIQAFHRGGKKKKLPELVPYFMSHTHFPFNKLFLEMWQKFILIFICLKYSLNWKISSGLLGTIAWFSSVCRWPPDTGSKREYDDVMIWIAESNNPPALTIQKCYKCGLNSYFISCKHYSSGEQRFQIINWKEPTSFLVYSRLVLKWLKCL